MERIETCIQCRRRNRVRDAGSLNACSSCHTPLILFDGSGRPLAPPQFAKPDWITIRGFIRYLVSNRRWPPVLRFRHSSLQYERAWALYEYCLRWFDQEQRRKREAEEAAARERHRRNEEEQRARAHWQSLHRSAGFESVLVMSGAEFEHLLERMFALAGYEVERTKLSGDQGADLLLTLGGQRIAVQAKRYRGSVGNEAVQELIAGMLFYGCPRGLVVTTGQFTRSARALAARVPNVDLWDRNRVRAEYERNFPHELPAFEWTAYRELCARSGILNDYTSPNYNAYRAHHRRRRRRR